MGFWGAVFVEVLGVHPRTPRRPTPSPLPRQWINKQVRLSEAPEVDQDNTFGVSEVCVDGYWEYIMDIPEEAWERDNDNDAVEWKRVGGPEVSAFASVEVWEQDLGSS